jgi:hypothetical protein
MSDNNRSRDDGAPVTRREMDQALKAIADIAGGLGDLTKVVSSLSGVVEERLGVDRGEYDDDDAPADACGDEEPEPSVSALDFLLLHGLDDVLLADDLVLDVALRVMAGGGAFSYHVADELAGGVSVPGFTHRVARVLKRLAKDGRGIVRLVPRSGVGPLLWFAAGVPLPAQERAWYVIG